MPKLDDYKILCQVKPKSLQTKFPYASMDDEQISKTLKRIELVYQHLVPHLVEKSKSKKGGGIKQITVVTC